MAIRTSKKKYSKCAASGAKIRNQISSIMKTHLYSYFAVKVNNRCENMRATTLLKTSGFQPVLVVETRGVVML